MQRSLIAIVIIAALVGGAILLGRADKPAGNAGVKPGPTNDLASNNSVLAPETCVLECENPVSLSDTVTLPTGDKVQIMFKRQQFEGGAIGFIEVPDNILEEKCHMKKEFAQPPAPDLPGKAVYEFDAPRGDTYYLQLRSKWKDTCGNSVWVRVDDGPWSFIKDQLGEINKTSYQWEWHPLMGNDARPKGFELKAGKHTLSMAVREDGPCFDKWIVSTSTNTPQER